MEKHVVGCMCRSCRRRRGETHDIKDMLSVRVDCALVARVRKRAADRGLCITDIVEEALQDYFDDREE